MSSAQTTMPPVVPLPPGVCKIFGDPHLITFDQKHVSFYSQGEYWIVKSSTVHIQGRYMPTPMTHGLAVTKEIAVGGPFLDGHILRINARTASWDGTPILTGFPSQWAAPAGDPVVHAQYNTQGKILQKGREGKALHIVHVQLPLGVILEVNRWTLESEGDYVNVMLTMPPQPGQDGHCGNFNGNAADDDRLQVRARLGKNGVEPGELLFKTKTPVQVAGRPNINDCPSDQLNMAEELCKKQEHTFIPSAACLIDVCFGGKHFAQGP